MPTDDHQKRAAVIGFGSQGRPQAARLRASGYAVQIGLPPRSRSRRRARALGFPVKLPERAVRDCATVALLVPDHRGSEVLAQLQPHLAPGALVVFAAGYPLVFGETGAPAAADLVLVAPHGPGSDLEAGAPVSGFVGVAHDSSGRAEARARRYAHDIGLAPLYETSPRAEALGDLFGEQALLCGGLVALTTAVAEIMVQNGLSPQNAYFETIAQLDRLTLLLKEKGIEGFWHEISDCAALGMALTGPRVVDEHVRGRLRTVWKEIASGRFARQLQSSGRPAELPAEWQFLTQLEAAAKKKGGPPRPPLSE